MQARSAILALVTAAVAACSGFHGGSSGEGTIVKPGNFLAGSGVISSVAVLPNANANAGGASGSSSQRPDRNLYRVSLQMDNGGFQQIDVDNGAFMAGQAVELTNDGRILLVSGTTLNQAFGK